MTDLLIVGSGLFGLTIAEQAASKLGLNVLILERRMHIGGNSYSEIDATTGIEVHKYGSHIFHTSNEKVWNYVNQFTKFNSYEHKVWAKHAGGIYPLPINLNTINQFFGKNLNSIEAEEFMKLEILKSSYLKTENNLEDRAIKLIGLRLYEAFIKNYTIKQWQTDPKLLPADVINRLPVRFNDEHRYFNDKYEGIPLGGYTNWLNKMIDNPRISVKTNTDYFDIPDPEKSEIPTVYTGPIDKYFNYIHGELTWRTLDFSNEILEIPNFQNTSVVNYSDLDVEFTRIHEYKHLHPERKNDSGYTFISKEYSRFASKNDEPYYPVNTAEDREKLLKYRKLISEENNVWFGGRLGSYQYLDMHMAIASALTLFENEITPFFKGK